MSDRMIPDEDCLPQYFEDEKAQLGSESTDETPEHKIERYEITLRAIASCTLTGADFGDWVQAVCEDALEGLCPECWNCGTFVHDGPCVDDGDESEATA